MEPNPEAWNGPGDWFIADYDGACTRGGEGFDPGTTVRTDGAGGYECRKCVELEQVGPMILTVRTGQDLPGDRAQTSQLEAWAKAFSKILPSGGER